MLVERGEYEAAIEDYNQAIELGTEDAFVYGGRALANSLLGNYEQAVQDYSRALELDPNYANAFNARGRLFADLGNYQLALSNYNRAIELNPDAFRPYYDRAELYLALGYYDQAVEDYNRVLDLGLQDAFVYGGRALAYQSEGNFEAAIADYTRAIELDPEYAVAYLVRGSSYGEIGNVTAAASDYLQWLVLTQSRVTDLDVLEVGKSLQLDMEAGQIYRVPFEAMAGEPIKITALSEGGTGADALIVLQDANGNPLIGDNNGAGNMDAAIAEFVIPADGRYTVLVSHGGSSTSGTIDLSVELASPTFEFLP